MGHVARRDRWAPFRRPATWVAIASCAVAATVVESLELTDVPRATLLAILVAVPVSVVAPPRSPWLPLAAFVGTLGAFAAFRLGGLLGFLALETALLLVALSLAVVARRRKAPPA